MTARMVAGRRMALRLASVGLAAPAVGCALPERGRAVPRGRVGEATVLGIPNERFLIPHDMPKLIAEYASAFRRRQQHLGFRDPLVDAPPYRMLGVSGGGEDGAFGAGLLCGWSAQGTRPGFDLVTGVSTGALTAPFAFLGPSWDGALRSVYTDITPDEVLRPRGILAGLFDDALADNTPLFRTIARHLDERMLRALAQGYAEGRLLFVGTANLDAQLPCTWNIGAIAASGHPDALALIRRVLLASAAVPGAFPPVMMDVRAGADTFHEMHVDGGAFTQVFLYPRSLTTGRRERLRRGERVPRAQAWIIRNGRLDAEWAEVDRRTLSIAGRAISTMIASSGYNDVVRIWNTTERDGVDFNLAFIGRDFTGTYTQPFEQAYMRALFEHAFERARRGYPWAKQPPV
ncbi:patatin-like phospholipase family protein [Roseomonas sp. PWR1]|uniref:Patatin-like phospholipase family protein n=1 Tax=Roseomonas nitratireducens TaxID=2820810 RepID=A0ABS4AR58_9PROT|nr:patatin-like phospholipase family protein [Neoroseomonas nitratireducens]MBP0463724.1 patatin-like phospholipase family protein [Neoroseomonas nitratireducens]